MNSRFLKRVDLTGLVLTVLVSAVWGVTVGWLSAASVAIGGTVALLNMIVIRHVLGGLIGPMASGDGPSPVLAGMFMLKFAAMGIVIFLLVAVVRVDVMALAIGMSVVPASIFIEFLRWNLSAPPSEPHADA